MVDEIYFLNIDLRVKVQRYRLSRKEKSKYYKTVHKYNSVRN